MNFTKEQQEAIDKDNTSIIVSAAAGSGKTAVLSERVIRKIKDKININELLILTFTNKAAMEMKDRIRKKIKKYKEFNEQLNLIDEAYITTFDSFALSIVKKYHQKLNVSKNINIVESSLIYLEKKHIIDDIFEEYYKTEEKNFINLINDFCTKDDNEIKECILKIYENTNLLVDKKEYLDNYVKKFYSEEFINKKIKEFEEIIISKFDDLVEIQEEISNLDYEYYEKLIKITKPLLESNNYDEIVENINFRLPNLKDADEELKNLKETFSTEIKNIKNLLIYDTKEDIKKIILSTKNYAKIIIEIINKIDDKLNLFKAKNNLYEFNDITKLLINLLKNNEDIRQELKNSYKEIMIDEYQDTSDMQEYFINLISNNNVYMVGDIKQSIYRFRNANPDIFKNKYDKYSKNEDGYKIDLNKNFRSRKEVLDNINLIFSKVMTEKYGKADYNNGHAMTFGNQSYEEIKANQNYNMEILNYTYVKGFEYSKDEIETFTMAEDIVNKINNKFQIIDKDTKKLRDVTYKDFVILIDRSTNFELIKKIFEYKHIPLTIYKEEKLNNEIEIILIKNIIKFILKINKKELDKEFKYLFTSIARSFLFEYNDNQILEILNENKITKTEIFEISNNLSKTIDYTTNYQLINNIITKYNFEEKIIKIADIVNRNMRINYILDLALSLDKIGYTVENFCEYLTELDEKNYEIKYKISTTSSNSVSIMSIHASKGLEFSICYFPFLNKEFNLADLKEKFLFDKDYGIITPYFDNGIGQSLYKLLLKNKYLNEEISEKIRLFYVALTRAKEKIIFITELNLEKNIKQKQFRNFLNILEFKSKEIKKYIKNIELEKINLSHNYNFSKKIEDLKINKNEKLIVKEINIKEKKEKELKFSKINDNFIDKNEQKLLDIGKKMHYYLEIIDFENVENYEIEEFYKNKIVQMLKNPIFKNLNCGKVYKEFEFIDNNVEKSHGIIDLMIIYDKYIDIIDYKLKNIDDKSYLNQLNGYKQYIEKKLNKPVNTYLYSILDETLKKI